MSVLADSTKRFLRCNNLNGRAIQSQKHVSSEMLFKGIAIEPLSNDLTFEKTCPTGVTTDLVSIPYTTNEVNFGIGFDGLLYLTDLSTNFTTYYLPVTLGRIVVENNVPTTVDVKLGNFSADPPAWTPVANNYAWSATINTTAKTVTLRLNQTEPIANLSVRFEGIFGVSPL